jgi:hypothetical protein
MQTEMYIGDCNNQVIGMEIQRCCVLSDIQIPETPALVVNFIRDNFSKLPFGVLPKCIDYFVAGKSSVKRPLKMNAHFLSLILREYIELNRHVIKMKPQVYLSAPAKQETETDRLVQRKKTYDLCYANFVGAFNDNKNALIVYIMEIIGSDHMNYSVSPSDLQSTIQWVRNYDERRDRVFIDHKKSIGKLVNTAIATKQPERNWDKIAIVYTHFIKRMQGVEDPWY